MSSAAQTHDDKLEEVRQRLTQALEARDAELAKDFGTDAPHEEWARGLYQHQRTELLVPAVHRWFKDGPDALDATSQAYVVGLVSHALRSLAPEEAGDAAFRLMFFGSAPKEFVLGVLRLAGGKAASEAFPRFADSLSKATRAAVEAGSASPAASDHISSTLARLESLPASASLEEQPLPQMEPDWAADGFMQSAVGATIGATHALEAVPGVRDLTLAVPEELRGPDHADDDPVQRARVFWTASAMAHVQMLVGAFHATGDTALLRRLCDGLAPVGAAILDGEPTHAPAAAADEPANSPANRRAVQLGIGGITMEVLVAESRRHPAVFAAVAAELAELAEAVPEGAVRSRGAEARLAILPQVLGQMAERSLGRGDDRA